MIGAFRKTGDGFDREWSLSWSVGADATVSFGERYGIVVGLSQKWIRDERFRESFDGFVEATAVTAGLMISFKGSN